MISVPLYNTKGNLLDPVEVDEEALGGKVRRDLLREAVQMYEMNRHVCTKATLSRSQVKATTHKLHRQKHTGYARAGQRTVPHRRGGGVAFAHRPRNLAYHMPRKARRNATRSALLARLLDGEVSLLNEIKLEEPKTRRLADILKAIKLSGRCLLISDGENPNVWKSGRNIAGLTLRRAADLNAYDLLKPDSVLFTQAAFQSVLEALAK